MAIAIPNISSIISGATKSAFESDAGLVLKQLEYEGLKNSNFDVTTVDETNINNFNLSNSNYENLQVGIVDNKTYIIITGKGKWDGLKACGNKNSMAVVDISNTETCLNLSTPATDESCFTFNSASGTITDYDGYTCPKGVIIPNTIGGVNVTQIGLDSFTGYGLTSVIIPSGITTISTNAFRENELNSIEIPNSVTTISPYAFAYNHITNATIDNNSVNVSCASDAFFYNDVTGNINITPMFLRD